MASKALLGLLLINALCFSHVMFILSNAVPVTSMSLRTYIVQLISFFFPFLYIFCCLASLFFNIQGLKGLSIMIFLKAWYDLLFFFSSPPNTYPRSCDTCHTYSHTYMNIIELIYVSFLILQIGDEHVNERMEIELNDYPGSGANNRHTPRPQFGRCSDC